jgi:site-specific DNA-methyltransferase (adenine-specific)
VSNNIEKHKHFNKITLGDSLELMKKLPDNCIDLVLTDHPYGTTQNKWDIVVDLKEWWKQIDRVTKPNTAVISFSAQPFTTDLINSNRKDFRYSLVWNKVLPVGFLNANRMPMRVHEDILVFYKKLPTYNVVKTQGHPRKIVKQRKPNDGTRNYGKTKGAKDYDSTERFPTSIMTYSTGGTRNKIIHPTEKPLELVKKLLRQYANKGDIILDTFSGSGVVVNGCIDLGMNYIAYEMNEEYHKASIERIQRALGEKLLTT